MRFWMRDLICHNLWNIQVNSVSSKSFDWGWRPYTSFLFVVHIKPTENMRGLQLQPWFHPYQHSIRFVFGTQYVCSWGCNLKRPFGTIGFFYTEHALPCVILCIVLLPGDVRSARSVAFYICLFYMTRHVLQASDEWTNLVKLIIEWFRSISGCQVTITRSLHLPDTA